MNKKLVVLVLLCSVSLRASMFRRQVVAQPVNLQFNSSLVQAPKTLVQAPKFEKIDAASKGISRDSRQKKLELLVKKEVDKAMSETGQASGQSANNSQSVAASVLTSDAVQSSSVWSRVLSGQKDQVVLKKNEIIAEKRGSNSLDVDGEYGGERVVPGRPLTQSKFLRTVPDKFVQLYAELNGKTPQKFVDASKPQSLSAVTPVETVVAKSASTKQPVGVPTVQSSTGQVADMSKSPEFQALQEQVKTKFSNLSKADVDKITQLVQVIKSENISQASDLFKNDKYKELRSQLYEGDLPGEGAITPGDLVRLSSGQSTPSAQQSFFGGLSRQLPGEVPLVAAKQQTALAQERPLEFKTLQEYTKAQAKAEDAAELKALQPINLQVNEQLNLQWQGVEEKYKQERQDLGQDIVPERVDLLKEQVKNKIYTELIAKNQSKIEEAKAQAVKEFQAKAVKPKPADGKFKLTDSKTLGPVQTESSVRAQAENKMKASLIESMVNKEFTSKFESAWVQDYALDYEIKNYAQASPAVISAAKDKYKKELALQMYSKLTPENKVSIKQAGENAVDAWNSQKQQDMTQVQAGSSGKGELKGLSEVALPA